MIKLIAAGAIGLAALGASQFNDTDDATQLGTSCNKVDITIVNAKSDQVKVTKLGYKVGGGGTEHSESLGDKVVEKNNGKETWKSQNLQHAPTGSKITPKVYFKQDSAKGFGSETSVTLAEVTCNEGKPLTFTIPK